jgi:O-antigen/teichoic acid export membrane protein
LSERRHFGQSAVRARLRPLRLRRSLEGGVAGSLAAGLVGQLVLIVSGIIVARALGAEGRGQLAVIVLVPAVLSQLGTFGVPLALTYAIARNPEGGPPLLRSLAGLISVQVVALTTAQVGIFLLLARNDERTAMLAAIPVMPALIAQQYGLAVLQGQQRFAAFNVLRVAPPPQYAAALAAIFAVGDADLVELVLSWVVTNVVVGLLLAVVSVRYAVRAQGRSSDEPIGGLIRYGGSAILGSSSPAEILRLDQAVIALSLSRTALGLYVVALAFTNLPRFVSQSVGMVAYPRIASAAASAARDLVRTYLVLVVLVASVVVALLELAVAWCIPWLFGADFADAVTTARILLVAAFLLAVRRVLTDVAQGLGTPMSGTVAELVNLSVALPLIALSAPLWGIEAAAMALTLGAAASLAVLAWLVRNTLARASLPPPKDVELAGSGDRLAILALGRGDAGS